MVTRLMFPSTPRCNRPFRRLTLEYLRASGNRAAGRTVSQHVHCSNKLHRQKITIPGFHVSFCGTPGSSPPRGWWPYVGTFTIGVNYRGAQNRVPYPFGRHSSLALRTHTRPIVPASCWSEHWPIVPCELGHSAFHDDALHCALPRTDEPESSSRGRTCLKVRSSAMSLICPHSGRSAV